MPDFVHRELSSWKEIASYLGVGVRTAQVWERERGLPVRRVPGKRGLVFADTAELDAWKASGTATVPEPLESPYELPVVPTAVTAPVGLRWQWWAVGLVVVVGVAVAGFMVLPSRVPSGFRVEGNALVVLDADGRVFWRKVFPEGLGATYDQVARTTQRRFWTGDLDGDGRVEVLFVQMPGVYGADHNALICYSQDGRERWRFVPGRPVRDGDGVYPPPYNVFNYSVARLDGEQRIVVVSGHYEWWPTQVVILGRDGGVLREYWHSGHLPHLTVADLEHDGKTEIYLAGVNNARQTATILVLDPATMAGASAEPAKYQLQGFPPGVERARIFFPRSCMTRATNTYGSVMSFFLNSDHLNAHIDALPGRENSPNLNYRLRPDLTVESVNPSDLYRSLHAELHATKVLDHPLTEHELSTLETLHRE